MAEEKLGGRCTLVETSEGCRLLACTGCTWFSAAATHVSTTKGAEVF